jgi:hypothetical protein
MDSVSVTKKMIDALAKSIAKELMDACKQPMTPNNLKKALIEKYIGMMSYPDNIIVTASKEPGIIDVLYPVPLIEFTIELPPALETKE